MLLRGSGITTEGIRPAGQETTRQCGYEHRAILEATERRREIRPCASQYFSSRQIAAVVDRLMTAVKPVCHDDVGWSDPQEAMCWCPFAKQAYQGREDDGWSVLQSTVHDSGGVRLAVARSRQHNRHDIGNSDLRSAGLCARGGHISLLRSAKITSESPTSAVEYTAKQQCAQVRSAQGLRMKLSGDRGGRAAPDSAEQRKG